MQSVNDAIGLTGYMNSRQAPALVGLRGLEFCPFSPFFAHFSTFTKIPQVPSSQAHSPVKTVFRQNPKNARKSQNTPSTNPYQNETQFPLSSLKNASGHARPPKSVLCPPVISVMKFRHGTAGLSNVVVSPIRGRGKPKINCKN